MQLPASWYALQPRLNWDVMHKKVGNKKISFENGIMPECLIDNLRNRLTSNLGRKNEIFCYGKKRILRLVELHVWWRYVVKYGKYNLRSRSWQILYIFVLRGQNLPFLPQHQLKNGNIFHAQYKYIQNSQTSQGYIFRILQHFATKLCNFTNS